MPRYLPKLIHWFFQIRCKLIYALGGKMVGARALVFKNNEVLLVRHTYREGWYTVGGTIERSETPFNAVKRELMEEAGIKVIEDPKLLGIYQNTFQNHDDYIYFYKVTSFTQVEYYSPEIAEAKFFPLDQLPEGVSNATKRRIDESLGNTSISNHW